VLCFLLLLFDNFVEDKEFWDEVEKTAKDGDYNPQRRWFDRWVTNLEDKWSEGEKWEVVQNVEVMV
jgi:hypothetical protein